MAIFVAIRLASSLLSNLCFYYLRSRRNFVLAVESGEAQASPAVCTENVVRIDLVTESHNHPGDGPIRRSMGVRNLALTRIAHYRSLANTSVRRSTTTSISSCVVVRPRLNRMVPIPISGAMPIALRTGDSSMRPE